MDTSSTYEYQIFMEEQGSRVLIASYFSQSKPPATGSVIDIKHFKEEDAYPDRVRVLGIEEPPYDETSIAARQIVVHIIVQPE